MKNLIWLDIGKFIYVFFSFGGQIYNVAGMMNSLLESLNPQQQQAVTAGLGPVLVLAGPGSGKTRVLTQRVSYLVDVLGVRPYHILAVTFTNKAAREMEARIVGMSGEQNRWLTLGTFHSICARILRHEAQELPFSSNFVIYDQDDQISLVKQALKDLNLDEKRFRPLGVHEAISNAKNELLLPDAFPVQNYRDETIQRLYRRYQELLLLSNALDFDDLLLWTAFLLEQNPAARDRYARRYEHVLVDEFQDTNFAQYTLLKHISSFHRNIFAVGDTDQSIYRWRGADYRNVLRFEQDFPDSQVILLEQNYRSTQAILDVAMAVIDRNPFRTPKRLFTERGQGRRVSAFESYDDRAEAAFVVDTITKAVAARLAQPGDFAVMYRTNAQSRLLEEAFLAAKIPYKLVGAQRFYGRREIKDLIAFLRLVHNPDDEISLSRIINIPPRGIGDKTLYGLRTAAGKLGVSAGSVLFELGHSTADDGFAGLSPRASVALNRFSLLLAEWTEVKSSLSPLALMDRILNDVEYHFYIDDGTEEGHERWENVMELRRLAAEYPQDGLVAFLEQVALVSDQDTLESNSNVPTLLTLHAAKGLEFPQVFIVGLNEGILPHSRSFDDPEAMMEERRLMYVGITRAMDRLYLVFNQNRSAYGFTEPADPSRFLSDIPYNLLEERNSSPLKRHAGDLLDDHPERWEISASQTKKAESVQQQYQPGMRVMHPTWGEGMVLNSRIQDQDEIVDVFFEKLGLKKLVASLANLEIRA